MEYRGDPTLRARFLQSNIATNAMQNKKIEEFNKAMQSASDKQGWFGHNILSGLAGLGGKALGAKLVGGAGAGILGASLLPALLAGAAVYYTTKGLKSGKWGGKVGKAVGKAKEKSKGRFSDKLDLGTAFDTFKGNIESKAKTDALIDSIVTATTAGLGDSLKGTGALGDKVSKFGNTIGSTSTKLGQMINPPSESFNIGRGILSDILKSPSFHTAIAPTLSKPTIGLAGLNQQNQRVPYYSDYSNLNLGDN